MPYGEEIIGSGNRTSTGQYQANDIRQGFTGYEKDDETGLDYAQARMYSNRLGRFTSADPLLSSGRIGEAQSWNRYVYTLNNPIRFTDSTGMYEYDENATKKQKKRFEKRLAKARKRLEDIEKKYTKSSDEYINVARALNAYGEANTANGVTVAFGKTLSGKPGETSGLINSETAKAINVTIDIDNIEDDGLLETAIAHEGGAYCR